MSLPIFTPIDLMTTDLALLTDDRNQSRESPQRKLLAAELAAILLIGFAPGFFGQFPLRFPYYSNPFRYVGTHWWYEVAQHLILIGLIVYLLSQSGDGAAMRLRPKSWGEVRLFGYLLAMHVGTLVLLWNVVPARTLRLPGFRSLTSGEIAISLGAILISSLFQELMFRVHLLTRLRQIQVQPFAIWLIATMVFGSWHLYEGYLSAAEVTIHGAIYPYARMKSGSLWPLVLTHAVGNSVALLHLIYRLH